MPCSRSPLHLSPTWRTRGLDAGVGPWHVADAEPPTSIGVAPGARGVVLRRDVAWAPPLQRVAVDHRPVRRGEADAALVDRRSVAAGVGEARLEQPVLERLRRQSR